MKLLASNLSIEAYSHLSGISKRVFFLPYKRHLFIGSFYQALIDCKKENPIFSFFFDEDEIINILVLNEFSLSSYSTQSRILSFGHTVKLFFISIAKSRRHSLFQFLFFLLNSINLQMPVHLCELKNFWTPF